MKFQAFDLNNAHQNWLELIKQENLSSLNKLHMGRLVLLTVYREFLIDWLEFEMLVDHSYENGELAKEARVQANRLLVDQFWNKWGVQVHWSFWEPAKRIKISSLQEFQSVFEIDPFELDDHLNNGMKVAEQFNSPYSLLLELDLRLPESQIVSDVREIISRVRNMRKIDPNEFEGKNLQQFRSPLVVRSRSKNPTKEFKFNPQVDDFFIFTETWKGKSFSFIADQLSGDFGEAGNIRKRFWQVMNFVHHYDEGWEPKSSKLRLQKLFKEARRNSAFARKFYFDYKNH